jgi:hypothetical protein
VGTEYVDVSIRSIAICENVTKTPFFRFTYGRCGEYGIEPKPPPEEPSDVEMTFSVSE